MNKWIAEFELEDGDIMPEHMDINYKGAKIDFHCKPLEQEPTTKNDLGVDCISRADALEMADMLDLETGYDNEKVEEMLRALPSVTPIRPKGHWIKIELPSRDAHECSECGGLALLDECGNEKLTDFCPNCGADMREVEE